MECPVCGKPKSEWAPGRPHRKYCSRVCTRRSRNTGRRPGPPVQPDSKIHSLERTVAYELERAIPDAGCLLTHRRQRGGDYPRMPVKLDGAEKARTLPVHRLVMLLKAGPLPEGMETRHLCGNRLCINPEHLVYDTRSENSRDTQEHGRSHVAHLTPGQVREIQNTYEPGLNQWQPGNKHILAACYGISPEHVSRIARGGCWKREAC